MQLPIKFLTCLILYAELGISSGYSHTVPQDAWMWNTLSIDKKVSQQFSIGIDEELRLYDNISRINLFFTNVGVNYQFNKNFKFSLVYRFIQKSQDDADYSSRHRLYFDAAYKEKISSFTLIYRVRFQGQVRDFYSSDDGRYIESYMRHKIDLRFGYNRFTPYIAAEFRFQFTNPNFQEGNDLWDRYRLYAGSDYKINRMQSIEVYYMMQRDFNNKRIERDYTYGVQYSISL